MSENIEKCVLGHETGSHFDLFRFDRTKTCRILRPKRISCHKNMKYVKTAPQFGLRFLLLYVVGGVVGYLF